MHVTAETLKLLDSLPLTFPVAIKSANSEVMRDGRATTATKTAYPLKRSDLERECRSRLAKGQSVLVQEFINGRCQNCGYRIGESKPYSGSDITFAADTTAGASAFRLSC